MYRVAKGGAITINSFLSNDDRNIAREYMLKTASTNMREAAKIGLQSLYADPNDVLEKYKDFDIVREMQARKGAKLLWVRARAIDADTVNANGDYFSKEELLKKHEIKGENIPAYKTFEGVPIYTNHKNDDIEQAKGMVVYAEWDEEENCVYCTFFVDEEAYPDIARNIRTGVIHDVSMGCSVAYGICSKCGNKAYYEKDYCDCLKKYKGKTDSSGKKVYEKNYDLKFIELSCVGDGAFETCEIQEIYDVDDILDAARDLEKKASEISSNIVLALQESPTEHRYEYEECLRVANYTAKTAVKLAQSAGTLVGGPLLAGEGANQNSTVNAVLQALGIDPRSGLNVLDLINLSLNFLEVSVLNLFARKDNVDLTHVSKISKAMADLQSTMQDMIDEGVDVGQGRPAPINQQQIQQAGRSPVTAPASFSNYTLDDSGIGRIMDFSNQDQRSNTIGGGVALASSNVNFVWASKSGSREVYASVSDSKNKSTNVENFVKNIYKFKEVLDNPKEIQNSIEHVVRVANERNKQVKTNTPKNNEVEGNKMDHFAKIASEQRKKLSAAVTIDFKVEDNSGNRVVLSTDGSITGYVKGVRTEWEPILSESQLSLMDNGQGTRVAADLLKDFASFTKNHPYHEPKVKTKTNEEELASYRHKNYDSLEDALAKDHKGMSNAGREELLDSVRSNSEDAGTKFYEDSLAESKLENAGLYARKVKDSDVLRTLTELVNDVNKGYPEEGRELSLDHYRSTGTAKPHVVMSKTLNALAKAVVAAMETPSQILKVAQTLAEEPMLPEMIGTAKEGEPFRAEQAEKNEFFSKEVEPASGIAAVLMQLASEITSEVTAADLANALQVAVEEGEITKEGVTRLAELLMENVSVPEEGLDVQAPTSKNEELRAALMTAVEEDDNLISKEDLKAAISGLAMSSKDTMATPGEVTDVVDSMPQEELLASIDRAKTRTATDARLRSRARREYWGVKTASSKDLKTNVAGWLADYSINFNISSRAITAAAKKLCADFDLAERLVSKAVEVSENTKTAGMTVTQDKSENVRFVCRVEDLDVNPTDANFEESFKQKAISVLQSNGFNVDPSTFTFTDLNISAFGDVTASISSRVSRSFKVDGDGGVEAPEGELVEEVMEDEVPVVMTEAAKFARVQRRNEILARYAQVMGGPGAVPGAPAGAADPMAENPTDYSAEPGVSGLTTGLDTEMNQAADTDTNLPGEEHPWGTICPVCGSDNTNIAESNGECQDCGTTYSIKQSLELLTKGDKGKPTEELPETGLEDMSGLGEATAPAPAPAAGETPGAAPMAPMASFKSMFRVATTIDADVYLKTAMQDFDRVAQKKLPIGMVCPKCGNREAHKVKNNTFCYKCNTFAKTEIKTSQKDPSKLDVSITWID